MPSHQPHRIPTTKRDLLFPRIRSFMSKSDIPETTLQQSQQIEGWLFDRENICLYNLAAAGSQLGPVVEIGSFKGKSTFCIARSLIDHFSPYPVYAIDPHTGSPEHGDIWTFDEFRENLQRHGIEDRVHVLQKYSADAVDEVPSGLGLLWIDGNHDYQEVRRDFELYFPKVKEGGWIAFHDTMGSFDGPTQLMSELRSRSDLACWGAASSITVFQRVARPGLRVRAENAYVELSTNFILLRKHQKKAA